MVLVYGGYGLQSLNAEAKMAEVVKKKKTPLLRKKSFWIALFFVAAYACVMFLVPASSHPHKIEVGPQQTTFSLFGSPLSNTFFALLLATVIFSTIIIVIGSGVKKPGSKRAILAEMVVVTTQNFAESILGHEGKGYEVAVCAFFGYILISNLLGIVSSLFIPFYGISQNFKMVIAPTTDLMVTTGFALTAISYYHGQYMKVKGIGPYLKHYVKPYVFMLPINILEEISRPLSLAVRLFGNLTGEHIVLEVISSLVAFVVPIVILGLGLFTGAVQALVFTMLFLVYLQPAVTSKGGH